MVTVAEFRHLDLPEDAQYELHEGKVVRERFPNVLYRRVQNRILSRLAAAFGPKSGAMPVLELPFESGENVRSADIGVVSRSRVESATRAWLDGAPELVVEVVSPSCGYAELTAYKRLCFGAGRESFWVVDPAEKTVTVYQNRDRSIRAYEGAEEIPIEVAGVSVSLTVNTIFEGLC